MNPADSEFHHGNRQSDKDQDHSGDLGRGTAFLQDQNAEPHPDRKSQLTEHLNIRDIGNIIHRAEHKSIRERSENSGKDPRFQIFELEQFRRFSPRGLHGKAEQPQG